MFGSILPELAFALILSSCQESVFNTAALFPMLFSVRALPATAANIS